MTYDPEDDDAKVNYMVQKSTIDVHWKYRSEFSTLIPKTLRDCPLHLASVITSISGY